jgi:integrase
LLPQIELDPITASKQGGQKTTLTIETNPTKELVTPIVKQTPKLPFSEGQWMKILKGLDEWSDTTHSPIEVQIRVRALLLLLRFSGLRMSDAVGLKREYVSDGRPFLYQAKTGHPVLLPLPDSVLRALEPIPEKGMYYFRTGEAKIKSDLKMWGERLKKVFVLAGLPSGHPHQLRDTFAVELLDAGTPIEMVSILLGHTSIRVTEKHYAPWVKSRNDALELAVKKLPAFKRSLIVMESGS